MITVARSMTQSRQLTFTVFDLGLCSSFTYGMQFPTQSTSLNNFLISLSPLISNSFQDRISQFHISPLGALWGVSLSKAGMPNTAPFKVFIGALLNAICYWLSLKNFFLKMLFSLQVALKIMVASPAKHFEVDLF